MKSVSRSLRRRWFASMITVWVMMGCGARQSLAPQSFGTRSLDFAACPADLPHGELGECALVEVPLDWSDPDGSERIVVFVRRYQSAGATSGNQVWALDGGPGFAGDVFTDPAIRTVITEAGYDLYIPTHRGTVYGSGLQCPVQQAPTSSEGGRVSSTEFAGCVAALREQWGEDLALFDSESAARDVRHLMQRTGADTADNVVVYGGSYGSYWGQRLVQVAPNLLDGVWLDSIVDLEASFERADHNSNDAGLRLLAACSADDDCSTRLALDAPLDTVATQVAAAYASGAGCGQPEISAQQMKSLFHRLLSGPPWDQALVAPLLVRAERCYTHDARAITKAIDVLTEPSTVRNAFAYNPLLNRHVMLSELFVYDRTLAEVERDAQDLLFSVGADQLMAALAPSYGPTRRRELDNRAPSTGAHLVLWQGGIDPLDPLEWTAKTAGRWAASQVSVVELPMAGHSVVRYAIDHNGTRCATEMLRSFLTDPHAALDRTCLERLVPFDFAATSSRTQQAAQHWFGTPEAWGEPAPAPNAPQQRAP